MTHPRTELVTQIFGHATYVVVVDPSAYDLVQSCEYEGQGLCTRSFAQEQLLDLGLQFLLGFVRRLALPAIAAFPKRKSKKTAFRWSYYFGLAGTDLETKLGFKPAAYGCHYPVSCHLALYEDIKVVRIADKPQTSAFEFLVQLVKVDVGEYRGYAAALGNTLVGRMYQTLFHDSCPKEGANQVQSSRVVDLLSQD